MSIKYKEIEKSVQQMVNRNQYYDFLRGIAILMVIAIHTFPQSDFSTADGVANIIIRQIVGCPVPLFLAISGFFLGRKALETRDQTYSFWKKQIPRVYIPVLIWSLPLLILAVINGKSLLINITLFLGCGYSIYYFVALIIQCYLLLPILQKVHSIKGYIITSLLSSICVVFISWFIDGNLPLIVYAGPVITWIIFFYMGIELSKFERDYNITILYILIPICIILCIIESYMLQIHTQGIKGFGIKLSMYIYSALMILLLFSKRFEEKFKSNLILNRIITYIGSISFGLYLLHCYFITIIFRYIDVENYFFRWGIVSVCSIMFVIALKKIIPSKYYKLLGLI